MRVIAGRAGGTRLGRVPRGTRPLSDRAREGLFASLGHRVVEARCADLFAGTGAVGIEALSRGAASCVFVESAGAAVRAIRENLERAGLADDAVVVATDVARFLSSGAGLYDLAFLDPPYDLPSSQVGRALDRLRGRLAPGAACVLTRPARGDTDVIPVHFEVARRLTYGDTVVLVLQEG